MEVRIDAMIERRGPAPPTLIPAAAEDLCLAYANTLSWRGMVAPSERLHQLDDLFDWLADAGLPPQIAEAARAWARNDPKGAAAGFAEAIALREAVYRAFAALATGDPVTAADFEVLNRALAAAPPRRRLMPSEGRYLWAADRPELSIPTLLASVLWSAADLLARAGQYRVRRCANSECLWLFIDRSKAGTRRWCDMSACGNRAKSRRHYLRAKAR
jgi:predicted RNA-binding Zn ribbon-like protein